MLNSAGERAPAVGDNLQRGVAYQAASGRDSSEAVTHGVTQATAQVEILMLSA